MIYQSFLLHPPHRRETASAWTCFWCGEHLIHISGPSRLGGAEEQALRRGQSLRWLPCWGGRWPSWGPPALPGRHFGEVRDYVGLSFHFRRCCHLRSRCPPWPTGAQSSSCLVNQLPPGEQQVSRDEDGSILELSDINLLRHTERQRKRFFIFVMSHSLWYQC